jgi:hypothetical protein
VDFCNRVWPLAGIFGPGEVRQLYLPPQGVARNYSYVEHDGLQYGAYWHTFGHCACYRFTNPHVPVCIERILYIEFPDCPELHTICAIVHHFQPPEVEPEFLWDAWYVDSTLLFTSNSDKV